MVIVLIFALNKNARYKTTNLFKTFSKMGLLYKRISHVDSPLTLTGANLDDLNSNQNSLVLDVDLSAGEVVMNLPSLTELIFGAGSTLNGSGGLIGGGGFDGGGGMSFYINGNIVAGHGSSFTVNAYQVSSPSELDVDTICGQSTFVIPAGHEIGTCFQIFITGRHSWCALTCVNHGS
jgi:hypothetical protein